MAGAVLVVVKVQILDSGPPPGFKLIYLGFTEDPVSGQL